MNHIASVFIICAILAVGRRLFRPDDDTEIIRQFVELSWQREADRLPLLTWAEWCKAGMQLGEFETCPPR